MAALAGVPAELIGFAGALLLRATVLLAGALLVSTLMGRASAAARHAFWSVTALGLLVLPWLPAALPALPVRLPWPVAESPRVEAPARSVEPRERFESASPAGSLPERAATSAPARVSSAAGRTPPTEPRWGWVTRDLRRDGASLALLLWGVGSLAAFATLLVALRRVARIAGAAHPITLPRWRESFERARTRVGVRRRVQLLSTPAASMPLAGGFIQPFVLLPSRAAEWSDERRELVLLHELVHVARHDALRQVVGRLVLALYWFHPLARIAARRALLAREQACDEAVLALGPKPSAYARHLLELAEPGELLLPALSLMERPHLEKRVMAILKTRRRSSRRATLAAAACASVWALTVAATMPAGSSPQATPAPQAAPSAPAPAVAAPAAPTTPAVAAPALIAPTASAPAAVAAPASIAPEVPAPTALAAPATLALPAPLLPGAQYSTPRVPAAQERTCWEAAPGEAADTSVVRYSGVDRSTEIERVDIAGGDRMIRTRERDLSLCMRTHGNVTFEEGLRIAPLEQDAWVVMGSRDPQRTVELVVTPGPSGHEYAWYVNGSPRPFDAEGAAWRDAMVPVLSAYRELAVAGAALARAAGELRTVAEAQRARVEGQSAELRALVQADELTLRALRQQLDSLRVSVPVGELERRRQELEAMERQMRDATPAVRDSLRVLMDRTQVQLAQMQSIEAVVRATRERVRAMESQRSDSSRVLLGEVERQTREAAAQAARADVLARTRRVVRGRVGDLQLEENVRRLREAIGRIP